MDRRRMRLRIRNSLPCMLASFHLLLMVPSFSQMLSKVFMEVTLVPENVKSNDATVADHSVNHTVDWSTQIHSLRGYTTTATPTQTTLWPAPLPSFSEQHFVSTHLKAKLKAPPTHTRKHGLRGYTTTSTPDLVSTHLNADLSAPLTVLDTSLARFAEKGASTTTTSWHAQLPGVTTQTTTTVTNLSRNDFFRCCETVIDPALFFRSTKYT